MNAAIEVIDVEEFHENLQRKSLDDLKRKNKKIKEENRKLYTKINHLNRANDALSHKLFEQDQRRIELARFLGFDSIESAEESITSEDPWIPGGKAALSEARDRILLLEDELAKHVTAGEEARAVITETKENLDDTHRQLGGVLEDIKRLRKERDMARQEAERHAMDASKLRMEIQNLIRKQQEDNKALIYSRLTTSTDKENITPERLAHTSSSLCEVANATSFLTVHCSPSSLVTASKAQRCKQQLELLQAQYEALRETKEKISKKFREQLMRWKKIKHWRVKEEIEGNCKRATRRRCSKTRKGIEEVGPLVVSPGVGLSNNVTASAQDEAAGSPKDKHIDTLNNGPVLDDSDAPSHSRHSTLTPMLSPVKSNSKGALASLRNTPLFEESLTQPSTVPASQHSRIADETPAPHPFDVSQNPFRFGNNIPMSQQSLTQPSSMPSLSPAPPKVTKDILHSSKEVLRPQVFVVDSPVREMNTVKREEFVIKVEETPQQNATDQYIPSSSSAPETPIPSKPCRASAAHLFQCQRPDIVQPISEPPRGIRLRHPSPAHVEEIRRIRTVLVKDKTRDTNTSTLARHRSSPPDSPHLQRMYKRKRKAVEMEESTDNEESDPFKARSSRVPATVFQARDEKLARLKTLSKRPHTAYMSEYLRFKGRGRYSNANASVRKTVNGEFEIDPDKNDGLDFQYDAIVRDKDERRGLKAGDCECCREYYEAIGPLPPRLQAPLWKSPSSDKNQHIARPCRYVNKRILNKMSISSPSARMHTKAVEDHKQSISRHRHAWAPPKTPPDFWKIEFPDTPTVNDINRRADEMHAHKFERVEAETKLNNGRYRKRT